MAISGARMDETVRIILGGDVMLGRIVKERIRRLGPAYPLGRIAGLMRGALRSIALYAR